MVEYLLHEELQCGIFYHVMTQGNPLNKYHLLSSACLTKGFILGR